MLLAQAAFGCGGGGGGSAPPPGGGSGGAGDTTPPTIAISAPAPEATVAAMVTVTVTTSGNVAVAGVQFKIDDANAGAEITLPPFSFAWGSRDSPARRIGVALTLPVTATRWPTCSMAGEKESCSEGRSKSGRCAANDFSTIAARKLIEQPVNPRLKTVASQRESVTLRGAEDEQSQEQSTSC